MDILIGRYEAFRSATFQEFPSKRNNRLIFPIWRHIRPGTARLPAMKIVACWCLLYYGRVVLMNIRNFPEKLGLFVIVVVRRFQCSRYSPVKQHQGEAVFCLKVFVGRRTAHPVEIVISMIGAAEWPFSEKRPSPLRRIRAFLGESPSGT